MLLTPLTLGLALSFPASPPVASFEQDLLARPGVRLLAVELYASWCKPCTKAVPRWEALSKKYRGAGLAVAVVVTEDPQGCETPPWRADEVICDRDGSIARALGADRRLPASFLRTWRGETLVAGGHVDAVEAAVADFVRATPRVHAEIGAVDERGGVAAPVLLSMVRAELTRSTKVFVVASPEERARLDAIAAESLRERYDEALQCEIGQALSANALLQIWLSAPEDGAATLQLLVLSAERGCLVDSAVVPWHADRPEQSVKAAVAALEIAPTPSPPPAVPAVAEVAPRVAAESRRTEQITVAPDLEEPGSSVLPWVLTGTGVSAVVVGVVFGAMARSTVDEARASPHDATVATALLDRGRKLAGAADVMFVSGAVLTVIGGYLWLSPAEEE